MDVIFGGNKFPIGVSETRMPEGIAEHANFNPSLETSPPREEEQEPDAIDQQDKPYYMGYKGENEVLKPGETYGSGNLEVVRPEKKLDMQEGLSAIPEAIEVKHAQKAARRKEHIIHDQSKKTSG